MGPFSLWRSHPSFAKEGIKFLIKPTTFTKRALHVLHQPNRFAQARIYAFISPTRSVKLY
jgi:hypothetical protein